MTTDGNQTVNSSKFYSTAVSFEDMYFVSALQGIDSVDDFIANKVSQTGDDVIAGHVTFPGGFDVGTDLNVDGPVDKVNISALLESLGQKKKDTHKSIVKTF